MVTLADIQGGSLVPNLTPAANLLLQTFGTKQERDERERLRAQEEQKRQDELARQEAIQRQIKTLADPAATRTQEQAALLRLGAVDPKIAAVAQATITRGDEQEKAALSQAAANDARDAALISSQGTFAEKQAALTQIGESKAAIARTTGRPVDLSAIIRMQNLSEDELDLELQRIQLAATDLQTILKPAKAPVALTEIGKARTDLRAGFITQDEFNAINNTPRRFQSSVGKLIADKKLAVNDFGANSPEALIFDEAISAASTGNLPTPKFETFTDVNGNVFDLDVNSPEGAALSIKTIAEGGRKGAPKEKKITAAQRNAAGFVVRVDAARVVIDELGVEFAQPSATLGEFLPNIFKSSERQRFEQAKRNFTNAILRKESGAAIAESEFVNAALQYFPQPGDGEEVLLQKAENRQLISDSLKAEAGEALTQIQDIQQAEPQAVGDVPITIQEGTTATNPSTGQKLIFRNGTWQIL